MKIYVDNLPKSCAECEHCTKSHEGSFGIPFCNIERMPIYGGNYDKERGRYENSINDFDCPLHSELETETKALKERWEKLKKFIEMEHELFKKVYKKHSLVYQDLLRKMQELEKESEDEV